jgi:hypothetical protein
MLKVMASSLAVLLGLAVAGAPAAAAHEFHVEVKPAILGGVIGGPSFFENTSNASRVKCKNPLPSGTTTATVLSEIRVHPSYAKCTIDETETTVEVKTTGCDYIWSGATNAEGRGGFSISCEAGKSIEVVVPGLCTAKFGSQKATGGVTFDNEGEFLPHRRVRVTVSAGGLVYATSGFFCSMFFGNGKDGVITGPFVVEAFKDLEGVAGEQVDFWVE